MSTEMLYSNFMHEKYKHKYVVEVVQVKGTFINDIMISIMTFMETKFLFQKRYNNKVAINELVLDEAICFEYDNENDKHIIARYYICDNLEQANKFKKSFRKTLNSVRNKFNIPSIIFFLIGIAINIWVVISYIEVIKFNSSNIDIVYSTWNIFPKIVELSEFIKGALQ